MVIKSFRIFESKLEYLESFESILKMIDSPLSKSLLSIVGKDLDLSLNFIGSAGEDFVNFIPDKKSGDVKLVYRVLSHDGFLPPKIGYEKVFAEYNILDCTYPVVGDLIYVERELSPSVIKKHFSYWRESPVWHCKSLDGSKNHIYLTSNNSIEKVDKIIGPNPQQIKIGRLARNLLKFIDIKFSDKDIEIFVNEFKSKYTLLQNAFRNFHLVRGDEISKWYLEDNYYDSPKGSLHSSCMRYLNCQEYFSIYVSNPDVCQLLILKSDYDDNKITGRALIWKLDNGDHFMDRIYFSKEMESNLFVEFAKSNRWVYKSQQGISGSLMMNGDKYNKLIGVKLSNFEFDNYPYLDTLCYLYPDGSLTLLKDESGYKGYKELRNADGTYIGGCEYCENGVVDCVSCDGDGKVDCYDCGGDGKINCSDCEGEGEIDCPDCDGSGDVDEKSCGNCGGSGKINCDECKNGSIECDSCYGNGRSDCGDCDGSGSTDCPECS